MSDFFLSWQLWEQMTFCLACAMVLVVCAALIRNAFDWFNLRKHVRILKEQQAEQAKLLQNHPSIRQRQIKNQVPFGVRAIQSGIEVDGVWISRPNSVFNSPSNTTPASPVALQPTRPPGNVPNLASRSGGTSPNPVAAAARQLEMQTSAGRIIPPRAARDPFRDSAAASERTARSIRSEKSEGDSQQSRKSTTEYGYRDMPDEEAGYLPSGASSKQKNSRRQSQLYQTENAYEPDYFSIAANQPQTYVPTRRTDQRSNTHNTYVPSDANHPPAHSRRGSSFGYTYPQGYSEAYGQMEAQNASPVEMDIGESYGGDFGTPAHQLRQSRTELEHNNRRDQRNSSYHMIFSNAGEASTGPPRQSTTPSPPQDPFANPGSTPGRSMQQPQFGQAIEMPPPAREPRDRAEAEAEASSMRRVNEGFSVARQGQRRDQESLAAAARELHAQSAKGESSRDGDGKSRKKLQKKDRRSDLVSENRRPSQFKENI